MTEFSEEHDELASAYLDGEATDDERARVNGDPGLLERVDELRRVRDAVATPPAPPGARARDDAISAALRASTIVDLGAERARRRLRIMSIAAAVLIVLGAAGLVIRSASSDSTKTSAATAAAGSTAPQADSRTATQGAGATSAAEDVPGAFSLEGREALGDFTDRSTLTDAATTRVRVLLSVDQSKTASSSSGSATTRSPAAGNDAAAPPSCAPSAPSIAVAEIYAATATLDGRVVQLDVFSTTEDTLVLVVTDAVTCAQVFTQAV